MDSELHVSDNRIVAYVGNDATQLFRVKMLRAAINLHAKTGMIPTRGVTITKMFRMAEQYTGQKYKRGEHTRVIADLEVWINTMLSALPVVEA
jgi:hypothetical protein